MSGLGRIATSARPTCPAVGSSGWRLVRDPPPPADPLSRRADLRRRSDRPPPVLGPDCELSGEGVTVFVTTHYMDEAESCDRLALIYRGA